MTTGRINQVAAFQGQAIKTEAMTTCPSSVYGVEEFLRHFLCRKHSAPTHPKIDRLE